MGRWRQLRRFETSRICCSSAASASATRRCGCGGTGSDRCSPQIRKKRVDRMRAHTHWKWHLDEVYVKINGEMRYLWRAVDHEGEVLESYVTTTRDKAAALAFIKKAMKRHSRPQTVVTDGLRSYGAAMKNSATKAVRRWANGSTIARRIHTSCSADESGRWSDFGGSKPSRSSRPSTARSTTTSIRNATSSAETSTVNDAQPSWRSGGRSWARARRGLGTSRPAGDELSLH